MLASDNQDNAGDTWNIIANTDNTFAIQNDISGSSDVSHVTITPNATVANSTVDLIGHVNVGHDLDVTGNAVIDGTALVTGVLTTTVGATFNNGGTAVDFLVKSDDSAAMFFVDGSEDVVGIGTVTPVASASAYERAALHIHQAQGGSTGSQIHLTNAATGAAAGNGVFIAMWSDDDLYITNQESDGNIKFSSGGNADALVIASDGSVYTGTAGTDNVRFGENAGNSIIADNAGVGNVLIGKNAGTAITSGDSNVAIGTDALMTEDEHANNVAIGQHALKLQNAEGDAYNVAVGYFAGTNLTTAKKNVLLGGHAGEFVTLGANSVFVGFEAGKGIDAARLTGGDNVGVGYRAGYLLQGTATRNTIVGYTAADALTTGSQNTVMGYDALGAGVASFYNTAFGTGALRADTTGRHSVAVGISALYSQNNTGSADMHNTAVGSGAGFSVSTGIQSTYIGGLAGYFNTTANNSTFVGFKAGYGLDGTPLNTGNNNTAVGSNAGELLQGAANNNTLIGAQAGDQITTGTSNVAVGYAAGSSTAASTGTFNTSVGFVAGQAMTTGNQNVAIGAYVSDVMTIGRYNTAVGYSALSADVLGDRTTAMGYQTANYQVAGSDNATMANSYFGMYAGHYNVTGTGNTAMGYQALFGADGESASNNVAIGRGAGGICRGDSNTFVGRDSGDAVTTGAGNTFIGSNSGTSVNTGATNTYIGRNSAEGATEGDGNVCLGYEAGKDQVGTASSVLYIARSNTGAGNDATWIHGTATGTCINGDNSTAWAQTSDERIKKNITNSSVGLDKINQVKIRNFEYRTFEELDNDVKALNSGKGLNVISKSGIQTGVIAQEIESIFPNDVQDIGDGTKIVTPSDLNYALIKAVQELSTALDAALARITTLEG